MSTNLVIVAIPEEQDRVWKISSEKVPHLTLLFLGEEQTADTQQIMQFVEHAVQMSEHGQFYLDVDRRGELGPDKADVIFFSKRSWNLKWIKHFRGQLLQNQAVRTAYDSTEQFEEWTPHLTLGYPEAPANEPENNGFDHPLYSVCFDRIAVWSGDFEGPEFQLEWPDREELEGNLAVAYSDAQKAALMHYGNLEHMVAEEELSQAALGEEFVEHVGMKGMKWGRRRDRIDRKGGRDPKRLAILGRAKAGGKKVGRGAKGAATVASDVSFENMAADGRARKWVVGKAHDSYAKKDLPKINEKPEYQEAKNLKTRLRNPKDPIVKQYRKEHREAYINRLEESANSMKNASGDREYTIRERGNDLPGQGGNLPGNKYLWSVSTRPRKAASHADNFDGETTIEVIMDEDGFIVDLKPEPEEATVETAAHGAVFVDGLVHGAQDLGEEFLLEHYGIRGMKWGRRGGGGGLNRGSALMPSQADAPKASSGTKRRLIGRKRGGGGGGLNRGSAVMPPKPVAPEASSVVPRGTKRKTKVKTEGGENHPATQDAIKVEAARAKLKKSGPKALTNQELRDVADRLRLEQQAVEMDRSRGRAFVRNIVSTQGKQAANQAVREGIQEGAKRVKR